MTTKTALAQKPCRYIVQDSIVSLSVYFLVFASGALSAPQKRKIAPPSRAKRAQDKLQSFTLFRLAKASLGAAAAIFMYCVAGDIGQIYIASRIGP